jgi:LEA14-like dessication related protein
MDGLNRQAKARPVAHTVEQVSSGSVAFGRWLPWLLGLLTLAVVTACTGIKRDTLPPEVSLSKVTLLSAGLFEQRWQLTLRTYNPNRYPLRMRGLKYQLSVAGNEMARGVSNDQVTLPANGEVLVNTQVTTSLMQMISQMQALQQVKEEEGDRDADGSTDGRVGRNNNSSSNLVEYRIDGSVILGSMPVPLPFSHEGKTTLPTFR